MVHLSDLYMTTGKIIALTIWSFVGKVMSLLLNTPSRFVIAILPRNKCLLISWLQSLSAMILEPKKIKPSTVSIFSPSICHEVMWLYAKILAFWCWILSQFVHCTHSSSSRDSLIPLDFLPLEWYHLHIWDCWYFSWKSWFQVMIHLAQHFTWCTLHISQISRVTIY